MEEITLEKENFQKDINKERKNYDLQVKFKLEKIHFYM